MQDLGISILFKGINSSGSWAACGLRCGWPLITIGLSCLFGLLFGVLMLSKSG
jgi:hypothetical protein